MKRILTTGLCVLLACSTSAVAKEEDHSFTNQEDLIHWASHSSWGGGRQSRFRWHDEDIIVVFRTHTSGIYTSELHVFLKRAHWIQILHHDVVTLHLDATLEGDELQIWQIEWEKKERTRKPFLTYNLKHLQEFRKQRRPNHRPEVTSAPLREPLEPQP